MKTKNRGTSEGRVKNGGQHNPCSQQRALTGANCGHLRLFADRVAPTPAGHPPSIASEAKEGNPPLRLPQSSQFILYPSAFSLSAGQLPPQLPQSDRFRPVGTSSDRFADKVTFAPANPSIDAPRVRANDAPRARVTRFSLPRAPPRCGGKAGGASNRGALSRPRLGGGDPFSSGRG